MKSEIRNPKSEIQLRILVIGPSNIGDALLMSGVISVVHQHYPTAHLTLVVGARAKTLFRPRVIGEPSTYRTHYAVTSDGQRFLVDVLRDPGLDPVTVLLNWAQPSR